MKLIDISRISVLSLHYNNYTLDYFLDCQAKLGIKNVELLSAHQGLWMDEYGYQDPAPIRRKLEERGLSCPVFTPENCAYGYQFAAKEPEHIERSFGYFSNGIRLANELGCEYMEVNSGWGYWNEPEEEGFKRSAEMHSRLAEVAKEYGPFDFVLADLGVSSMQIDNPERGFTYKYDGPLDLRLNPHKGISAAQRLENIREDELEGMFIENSDEPYAAEIAKAIVERNRKGQKITTTLMLKDVIEEALSFIPQKERKEAVKKSCARTFQALRIDVNNEFEVLYDFLEKLPDAMAPGGRVAILTFHSGEDRLVKKAFKALYKQGIFSEIAKDVIRPSAEECNMNPRARSTKMRWAIKN